MKIISISKKIIFYIALFLMSFMFSLINNYADLDLWHRLAVGKIFSQLGHVIYHDIFSYFPTKPLWIDHEWLSGVVFYNLSLYFGDFGIMTLKIVIIFTILFLIHRINSLLLPNDNKYRIIWYFITLLAILPGLSATIRCQIFTYLFFTLWIYVLERTRRGENKLVWIFPATTLLWANLHAGFIAGFGLILFYAAGEFLNRKNPAKYFGILALCLPVTLINPYGPNYWHHLLFDSLTVQRNSIVEWMPLNLAQSFTSRLEIKIQLTILILSFVNYLTSINLNIEKGRMLLKEVDWVKFIALATTIILGFQHNRHIIFFSLLAAVYGYRYYCFFVEFLLDNSLINKIKSFISEETAKHIYFAQNTFIYIFVIYTCFYMIFTVPWSINVDFYPAKAVEFARINKLKGNLLIPFNWGSYALWKLYPQNLVSVDGRYEEPYTRQSYDDICTITFYRSAHDRKNFMNTLNKYHHDVILTESNSDLEKVLTGMKKWKPAYKDKQGVVLIPFSAPDKKWLHPTNDKNYYIKTKYKNNINF